MFQLANTSSRTLALILSLFFAGGCWAGASKAPKKAESPSTAFNEFLFGFVEKGKLRLPQPVRFEAEKENRELDSSALGQRLKKLYSKNLKKMALKWEVQELQPAFWMHIEHPVEKYYNRSLIWALGKDGKKIAGFRPVDTSTGCDTGCTPIVFHLKVDPKGKALAILQEDARPLRKIGHQALSREEIQKLEKLAAELPDALRWISESPLLVDNRSGYPPHTWTFFAPYLIEGGAFTSFRIYESALSTLRALSEDRLKLQSTQFKLDSFMGKTLRTQNAEEAFEALEEAKKILLSESEPWELKQMAASISPYILLWLNEFKDVRKKSNEIFSLPLYRQARVDDYCGFLENLLATAQGRHLLLETSQEKVAISRCGKSYIKTLRLLSAHLNERSKELKALKSDYDFSTPAAFLKEHPQLLSEFVLLSPPESQVLYLAELETFFPKFSLKPEHQKIKEKDPVAYTQAKTRAEAAYKEELTRSFLPEPLPFPTVVLEPALVNETSKSLRYPKDASSAQIHVFFSAWCPHCQQVVRAWVDSGLSKNKSLWSKIRFIEIFSRGNNFLGQFCSVTKISDPSCESILRIDTTSEQGQDFTSKLGIFGVPRIMLTTAKGKIVDPDLNLAHHEYADLERDLEWLLEEARKK